MRVCICVYVCVCGSPNIYVPACVCVAYALDIWFVRSLKFNVATDTRSVWVKVTPFNFSVTLLSCAPFGVRTAILAYTSGLPGHV